MDKNVSKIVLISHNFFLHSDDCYFLQPRGNNTGSGVSYPRYRPCEYAISSDGIGRQCIVSSLFCDNVIHCAPTDEKSGTDFGQDESELNCPHIYHQQQSIILPDATVSSSQKENEAEKRGQNSNNHDDKIFKRFFDEREEHLANLFKSAIIGFVGICTICILVAFVISIFCWKQKQYHLEHQGPQS